MTFTQEVFWKQHPAFLSGVLFLLGTLAAFGILWALLPAFFLFLLVRNPLWMGFFWAALFAVPAFHELPSQKIEGEGLFEIKTVSSAPRGGWVYKGTLIEFDHAKNLPCSVFAKKFYPPNKRYKIHGVLKKRQGYLLKSKEEWIEEKAVSNLVCLRLKAQESAVAEIKRAFPEQKCADLFCGLMVGQLEDLQIKREFNLLGLSHLLAISGFHFSLVASFFYFFLSRFFSPKFTAACLVMILGAYLLFLGEAPSVERAWISSSLFFLGHCIDRKTKALNSLGVALTISLLLNPFFCLQLGFQLSFLATGALLLLTPLFDELLQNWIPDLPFSDVSSRSLFFQHLYLGCSFFRKALALSLAVHGALLPFLLSIFHQFAWHSLLYNLFFPFFVSLSMVLFFIALPFTFFLAPIGALLNKINSVYTTFLLTITENPPLQFPTFYVENIPDIFVVISLMVFLFGGIELQVRLRRKRKGEDLLFFKWL